MKILHTSDWHIGKKLGSVSRIEEQKEVLAEICTIADEQSVDAIIIAGDIFDTYNPPIEAVELFYARVKQLSQNGKRPVIAIAGNHDSPDRIEAPNPLARDNGIFLFGYPKTEYQAFSNSLPFSVSKSAPGFIEFTLEHAEKLRVIIAPFANEHRMHEAFIEHETQNLQESLSQFWAHCAQTYCDSKGVNIMIGHHLMLAHTHDEIIEPDDEKPIMAISELLPVSIIPPQIQYVALGHLHRHQIVAKSPFVAYSGSPCAYSFSEANQDKYVSIVHLVPGEPAELEKVTIQSARKLLQKTCSSVSDALSWLSANQNIYVELTIESDTYLTPQEISALHKAHSGIIYIIPKVEKQEFHKHAGQNRSQNRPVEDLFQEYFEHKTGQKPHADILALFSEIRSKK